MVVLLNSAKSGGTKELRGDATVGSHPENQKYSIDLKIDSRGGRAVKEDDRGSVESVHLCCVKSSLYD